MRIGVDLDNTIICYDALFHALAVERGWVDPACAPRKETVRNAVWRLPDGDEKWQALQAEAYGPRLERATLFPGVAAAFRAWREQGHELFVISHKTPRSGKGDRAGGDRGAAGYDLHAAARAFLARGVLMREGLLPEKNLFFCPNRQEKLRRIGLLGCGVFIDDLPEVFVEPGFPPGVRKIHFAPDPHTPSPDDALICRSWDEAAAYDPDVDEAVARVTGSAPHRLTRVNRGRNSRVWKAEPGRSAPVAVKRYRDDGRDRLGAESAAFALLRRHGLTCVPEPRGLFPERRLAVYSWIAGAPAGPPGDAPEAPDAVDPFADLIERLHRLGAAPDAAALPPAAEACLCLADVQAQVESRLSRLLEREPDTATARAMLNFVRAEVVPTWENRLHAAHEAYARIGRAPYRPLDRREQILSPSDFGSHNAVRRPDGSLAFVDFEYFGWDDPVKLTADFLLHPAMRLTKEQKERFTARVLRLFAGSDAAERLPVLLPLFGVRWIGIVLKDFLPASGKDRRVARGEAGTAAGRTSDTVSGAVSGAAAPENQLEKARFLLRTINQGG